MFRSDSLNTRIALIAALLIGAACGVTTDGRNATAPAQSPGCNQIAGPRSDDAVPSLGSAGALRRDLVFSCLVHAGDPPLHVRLVVDTAAHLVSRIEIRRDSTQ